MNRISLHPVGWLLLASVLTALLFCQRGVSPEYEPDSSDYLEFTLFPITQALQQHRTFGYPLFLEGCRFVTGDVRVVPLAQMAAMILASWVMYWGLCQAGYRPSTAGWCAVTPMLGQGAFRFGTTVTADSLAISLAVASAACFLATTAPRSGTLVWFGFVLLTFLTYQTRPAYLFLIPLSPLLGWLLDRNLLRPEAARSDRWRRVVLFAAATGLPFVAFCTVRWAVVGHWGLVSFGGYNTVGVAGQLLDEELASELPEDLRLLATEILRRRAADRNWIAPSNFIAMEEMYNPMVWGIAVPAAKQLYADNPILMNQSLGRLSTSIIQRRPILYVRWLRWNVIHAFKQVVLVSVTDLGTMLAGVLYLLTHGIVFFRWQRTTVEQCLPAPDRTMRAPGKISTDSPIETYTTVQHLESHLLFWTAISFAAFKVLLVILVEPANDRYMTGAMPLIPAALMVPAAHYFNRMCLGAQHR